MIICDIDGVSGSAQALTIATSSTNGAAYGAAGTVSVALSAGANTISGAVHIYNIGGTTQNQVAQGVLVQDSGADKSVTSVLCPTNTAAVVNAIRFAWTSGSFDAGTIRVYGVK